MPGYDALNDFVNGVDPQQLAKALNAWLAAHQGLLPRSLALDGKEVGHALGAVVSLCAHQDGRPVALESYTGQKDDCEPPIGRALLEKGNLENAVVTADALHCQKKRRWPSFATGATT